MESGAVTFEHASQRINEATFEEAKHSYGDKKINAIERLEPMTQDIRDWILLEGADEREDDTHAFIRLMKSEALERLKTHPTEKEFAAIAHILSTLYEFGGFYIDKLPGGSSTLDAFLTIAEERECNVEIYDTVLFIKDCSSHQPLIEHASRILHSDACIDTVKKSVKEGKGILLAKALGIPYQDQLLKLMKHDFKMYYQWANTLLKPEGSDEYVDQVLEIYRRELPPDTIEQDPRGTDFYDREENEKALPLMMLLQNIGYYPEKGEDYVRKSVYAPALRCRAHAVRVIAAWVTKKGVPLENSYPELYMLLKDAILSEKSNVLRELIQRLLNGEREFLEDEVVDDEYDIETDEVNNYW